MYGIDLTDQRGVVAVFQDYQPVVIGEAATLQGLADLARSHGGESGTKARVVAAVPAWFNDVQRREVAEQVKATGLGACRLINRPTAAVLAYLARHPADHSMLLVIELERTRCDVTVVAKTPEGLEVLASDGLEFDPATGADTSKLAGEIATKSQRALKEAGLAPDKVSQVVCAGCGEQIAAVHGELESALGQQCATQIRSEHVVALGAAVQAGFLANRGGESSLPADPAAPPAGAGCAGVLLVLVLATMVVGLVC